MPKRRGQIGLGFKMSAEARTVLRAVRDQVDPDGVLQVPDERAAFLAELDVARAAAAIDELGSRGFVRRRFRPAHGGPRRV